MKLTYKFALLLVVFVLAASDLSAKKLKDKIKSAITFGAFDHPDQPNADGTHENFDHQHFLHEQEAAAFRKKLSKPKGPQDAHRLRSINAHDYVEQLREELRQAEDFLAKNPQPQSESVIEVPPQ
ncbi:hypothetical protein M3Y99_00209000 [Aphelenchoides fujianensis]|nr:hypothetical protein M3Y99_00209000 [Aphelenchoides fujianensis]